MAPDCLHLETVKEQGGKLFGNDIFDGADYASPSGDNRLGSGVDAGVDALFINLI
jgi:hypothetical protein